MWPNLLPFIVPVDPSGTATWTGIPNATALFGIPIYVAGGTSELGALPGNIFWSYTDPIVQ